MTTVCPPLDKNEFGSIPETEPHLEDLWNLVHSQPRLQKAGYVLWPLGQADLDKKKRCARCTKGRLHVERERKNIYTAHRVYLIINFISGYSHTQGT